MAEIVGLVASGISIAQLASQVGGCIIKLKGYWAQVQQGPDDIAHLLREIDSLNLILGHIQNDQSHGEFVEDNLCMRQSLQLCKEGADELSALVAELATKIEGKVGLRKKFGSVKIILKKDDMKRLKRRMKIAIRLLSLAYQCHTSAIIRSQPEIIVSRILTIGSFSIHSQTDSNDGSLTNSADQLAGATDSSSHDLTYQQYSYWARSSSCLRHLFGSLDYQRHCRQRRKYEGCNIRYKLPDWLSAKVLEIESYTTPLDWRLRIKTYRILPYDAPIWKLIKTGDLSGVRKMLASGAALVTDRGEDDRTLLYSAAMDGNFEICKLLIREGADVCSTNSIGLSCLPFVSFRKRVEGFQIDSHDSIQRLLFSSGICDGLDQEVYALQGFIGNRDTFRYFQQNIYPPYYELPLELRMYLVKWNFRSSFRPDLTRMAITHGKVTEEIAKFVDWLGDTFLHCLLCRMESHLWFSDEYGEDTRDLIWNRDSPWRELIRDFVSAGSLLHAINTRQLTPLGCIIYSFSGRLGYWWCQMGSVFAVLRIWLSDLLEVGVDLQQYGAEEKLLHLAGSVCTHFNYYVNKDEPCMSIDLIGFSYGPHPEDWHFWFSDPTDDFARDFWYLVEDSAYWEFGDGGYDVDHTIPGSWIECS